MMSVTLPEPSQSVNNTTPEGKRKTSIDGAQGACAVGSVSNTDLGLHNAVISSGVDHLSVSIPSYPEQRDADCEDLCEFLRVVTGEEFDGEVRYFTGGFEGVVSINGATIKWATEQSIISRRWIFLILPGKVCKQLSAERMSALCSALATRAANCTRIDFQTTVEKPEITMEEIHEHLIRGNWSSKSREFESIISQCKSGKITGYTLYVGSRDSQSFIRIYDKGLEEKSGDHNEKIRFEVELKSELAKQAFLQFAEKSGDESAEFCRAAFLSRIDFRDVENARGKRTNYAKRFAWYEKIFQTLPCRWAVQAVKKSLERAAAWVNDAVAPMLATIFEGIGAFAFADFLHRAIRRGQTRMSSRHSAILREYRSPGIQNDVGIDWSSVQVILCGSQTH